MSGPNRSLRRKPPPPLDHDTHKNTDLPASIPYSPSGPLVTPEKPPVPFSLPYKQESKPALIINADLSYESNYGPDHAEYAGYAEDSLLSYESPRLKGPQNLPLEMAAVTGSRDRTYNEPDSPTISRKHAPIASPFGASAAPDDKKLSPLLASRDNSYRQRKFQNLSQRGTSPFQLHDSDEEGGYFGRISPQASANISTPSPTQLPYPLSDAYSSDYYIENDGNDNQNYHQNYNMNENGEHGEYGRLGGHDHVTSTPTRIPTLVEKNAMKVAPLRHESSSPEFRFLRNSPPRIVRSPSTSPDSNHHYLSSPSSSPTRVSLYGRSPQMYSGVVSDSRSSRSPSPKKYTGVPGIPGTSPSAKPGLYPYSEDYSDVFEDYYNQERVPRWSLIENDEFEYDDSFLVPQHQFDYTILPELPKLEDEYVDRSTILEQGYSPKQALQPTLTIKRKNDDLPPVPLDLPPLPFSPSALGSFHFAACSSVWSLGSIFQWCLQLNKWTHGQKISIKEFRKVLMRLIAFHKQDVPIDMISRNVTQIIDSFTVEKLVLVETETEEKKSPLFTFNVNGTTSGVLVDLTSCYCNDDDHKQPGRRNFSVKCYSSQCMINKMIQHEHHMRTTNIQELVLGNDWASHWKLAAQDMAIDLSESKRQSYLFDLIKFEQNFIQRAECFIEIAGPEFLKSAKLMVGSNSSTPMKEFEEKIMNAAKELLSIHRSSLYEPLLKVLVTDGKFIKDLKGMASLYETWAYTAKAPLLSYISVMPMIEDLLANSALKKWDELVRLNPRMKALQVNGNLLLMSTFNSRYQQLPLQLLDIRKFFDEEDEEYVFLTKAVDAIRQLGSKVNEMKVHSDNVHALRLVEKQLTWKSSVYQADLKLKSSRRKFFYRGDLIRKGDLKINSHSAHLIVLDNYLLITERQRTQKTNNYKVTETPIPMDYLIVENREKEAYGISVKSVHTSNNNDGTVEETSSYPFKIRYAGRGKGENHTLIAATEKERKRWISVLVQARTNLLKKVSPVTPYNFELVESTFFAYEPGMRMTKLPILCASDPLAILAKQRSEPSNRHSVQRHVQCSYMFTLLHETFTFLGTNSGVYCSDGRNTWKKIINMNNVAKVTVVPDLNVVLVLASKTLRYYPLQSLINIYYERKDKITSFQLSNEGILFYEFGRHRGLPTLFVAKKKTAGTTSFKVYVMELDNNGIFSMFTVLKRFYIQAECHGVSVFNSSVAVHTQRGFEVLDLQKLTPRGVPELPASESSKKLDGYSRKKVVQSTDVLKKIISHALPMGMYKLSNNKEFLMVYNECAIFVNKSGKLSRTSTIRFDFRPRNIAFMDNNLFLVCEEVIEVWSISSSANGTNKLIQVIPSKGLHMLDPQTLSFKSANPSNSDLQLIFRMVPKPESTLTKQ